MFTNYSCCTSKYTKTGLENLVEFNEIIKYEEKNLGSFDRFLSTWARLAPRQLRGRVKVMTRWNSRVPSCYPHEEVLCFPSLPGEGSRCSCSAFPSQLGGKPLTMVGALEVPQMKMEDARKFHAEAS